MTINKSQTIDNSIQQDKRRFLGFMAKSGALASLARTLPLAGAVLASRYAEALPSAPKKFILLYHPGGAPRKYLDTVAVKPFKSFGNAVAALTMSINKPGNHGYLFNSAGANSWNAIDLNSSTWDQQVANTIGHLTPFRSLELTLSNESLSSSLTDFSMLNTKVLRRIGSPDMALQALFGVTGNLARRRAVLTSQQESLQQLLKLIGLEERFKLEAHLAATMRLMKRIERDEAVLTSCKSVEYTQGETPLNQYRAQGDVAVSALACGLTNVVSIQFNNTQCSWFPNDGSADAVPVPATVDHHNIIHGGRYVDQLAAINEYMNKGMAHIINRLIEEDIFKDTLLLCVSEMGDPFNNSPDRGPITVASGIAGFKGGNRNLNSDHYQIFPDVVKLLGLESAIGKTIHNYTARSIIA
jgi:hypothetical protein